MTTAAVLVGTADAATILGVSHRTVHRLVRDKKLPVAVTAPGGFAGAYLYRKSDVEKIRRQRAATPTPKPAAPVAADLAAS